MINIENIVSHPIFLPEDPLGAEWEKIRPEVKERINTVIKDNLEFLNLALQGLVGTKTMVDERRKLAENEHCLRENGALTSEIVIETEQDIAETQKVSEERQAMFTVLFYSILKKESQQSIPEEAIDTLFKMTCQKLKIAPVPCIKEMHNKFDELTIKYKAAGNKENG
jgi:hypothetical protein